jgi:hypothetical protein
MFTKSQVGTLKRANMFAFACLFHTQKFNCGICNTRCIKNMFTNNISYVVWYLIQREASHLYQQTGTNVRYFNRELPCISVIGGHNGKKSAVFL